MTLQEHKSIQNEQSSYLNKFNKLKINTAY